MINTSKVYESKNYGKFKITNYKSSRDIDIKFIDTGFISNSDARSIRQGVVKDLMFPFVYGIGFIGTGSHSSGVMGNISKCYDVWHSMLARCYDPKYHNRQPTYKDCTVCDCWHNFQNFAEWFYDNYIEGFQLDKDIKVKRNKIYSPETCTFVSHKDNVIEAHAKNHAFINPDGHPVFIYNLQGFCRANELDQGCMSKVHLGKRHQHKGWTKA